MTREEINALLAEADGWDGKHDFHFLSRYPNKCGKFQAVCGRCGVNAMVPYDGDVSCPPPSYTTSYPDLARVEKKVYGELRYVETRWLHNGKVAASYGAIICDAELHEFSQKDSELYARAECCARVFQQQGEDNE